MNDIISVVNVPTDELVLRAELNSSAGADEIGISDAGSYYDSTTVEDALQEIPSGGVPFDTLQVGDVTGGDYTEFEDDGTMVAYGDATVFEDLNFDPSSSGGPAATIPDYVTINNVIHREFTSLNNQLCGDGEELPHSYKLSSLLYPHAHIFLKSGESVGTTGVTFTLYRELRQSTGTTSGSTTLTATSAQLGTTAGANKFDIYNGSFAGASELGAQLSLTMARTGGDAGDVVVLTYGVHYEVDMLGSHTLTTK